MPLFSHPVSLLNHVACFSFNLSKIFQILITLYTVKHFISYFHSTLILHYWTMTRHIDTNNLHVYNLINVKWIEKCALLNTALERTPISYVIVMSAAWLSENLKYSDFWDTEVHVGGLRKENWRMASWISICSFKTDSCSMAELYNVYELTGCIKAGMSLFR
jgi:hypothetical protein